MGFLKLDENEKKRMTGENEKQRLRSRQESEFKKTQNKEKKKKAKEKKRRKRTQDFLFVETKDRRGIGFFGKWTKMGEVSSRGRNRYVTKMGEEYSVFWIGNGMKRKLKTVN